MKKALSNSLLVVAGLGLTVGLLGKAQAVKTAAAPAAPARLSDPVSPARLEKLSRAYLGTPYFLDALGEGSGPDRDPLFTRKCVDCQTLVEQVMAEAVAPAVGGQDRAVRLIRYHGEKVSLENRYHYCIPDWLSNPWPAQDITAQVGGKDMQAIQRRIDLPRFLASRGGDPKRSPVGQVQAVNARYIPLSQVAALSPQTLHGTIGVWVMNKPDIVAAHVGFIFNQGGKAVFRHASQRKKRVIDQPLADYAARAPKSQIGLMVLKPTMAGLKR